MPVDPAPLFLPLRLNSITLRNRFVMPGMQRGFCSEGRPLPKLAEYYRRRAEGGIALVISESCAVAHPSATQQPTSAWLREDTAHAWARCVEAVKAAGSEMLMQLWHEGALRKEGGDGPLSAVPTLSPSGLVYGGRRNGRAAGPEDLDSLREAWVTSAKLAREIGAAGIELHACHGYMLDQFLWAETNRRDDGYGGEDIRHRTRFVAEIVAAIRAACGPDFVVSVRFSQWKEADYDAKIVRTPEELELFLRDLRAAGADVFHASTRRFWVPEWPGSELSLAGWSKSLTDRPVITVGSVGLDVDVMDSLLLGTDPQTRVEESIRELLERFARREFDLVSVGRGVIGDPDWVNKVRERRFDEIRPFTKSDLGNLEWDASFVEEAHGIEAGSAVTTHA
jgi:2,4-dienoyl-CoA reductase-like NADH-dependent reductase (Old Yellow Enzyme family)